MIKNKCIVITGAAGFIGSTLTETLLKHDNLLILIDNFNDYYPGKEKQLMEILSEYSQNSDYKLIKGDLVNFSTLSKISEEVDYIFHLAAQAGVRHSINNSSAVTKNNLVSTVNVLEYSINIPSVQKVIYASSSSVYGNPVYTPVDEKHPKSPISPYAVTKLCGEIYADLYYKEQNLPITSLRFYTVYGPRERPDMAIRKFFDLMLKDRELLIFGDGTQIRDFTYVSDIVDGLILAGEKDGAKGEIFNLGSSSPISVNNLVDKMYDITKVQKKIKYVEKQKGDVESTHSDITKARKLLGFSPKVNIDEGLANQYQWQTLISL